jgi:hypothetical protein
MRTQILKVIFFVTVLAIATSGCALNQANAAVDPSAELDRIRTLHVMKHDSDQRELYALIAENLRKRGYTVTASVDKPSTPVDAVVTYSDRWMWDITMYLLELRVNLREPATDFPLATGHSMHTSLTRLSPEDMVNEVFDKIFKNAVKPNN